MILSAETDLTVLTPIAHTLKEKTKTLFLTKKPIKSPEDVPANKKSSEFLENVTQV